MGDRHLAAIRKLGTDVVRLWYHARISSLLGFCMSPYAAKWPKNESKRKHCSVLMLVEYLVSRKVLMKPWATLPPSCIHQYHGYGRKRQRPWRDLPKAPPSLPATSCTGEQHTFKTSCTFLSGNCRIMKLQNVFHEKAILVWRVTTGLFWQENDLSFLFPHLFHTLHKCTWPFQAFVH